MVSNKHLLDHIEALLRISHDVQDRAISAKLREMADELRILISVADVADLAANLGNAPPATVGSAPAVAPAAPNEMVAALYESKPKRKRKAKEKEDSDAPRPKPKRKPKKRIDGD